MSSKQDSRPAVNQVAWYSATALVIANIIGAGIFTTTGFQAAALGHPLVILALWLVGGLLAWCGAQCYAELGAMLPRAGGEYAYLRETFGPLVGFMSACVSLVAGFSAAIAAALKSLSRYLSAFFPSLADPTPWLGFLDRTDILSVVLVWLLVAVHSRSLALGFAFNDLVTLLKVAGILLLLLTGFSIGNGDFANLFVVADSFADQNLRSLFASFSVSLIFVMFCFSGWNAAAYIAHEMADVRRNLPRALLLGTLFVTTVYLALNVLYFYGADVNQLAGVAEVGLVATRQLFGAAGTSVAVLLLSISIFASASAMTIAGPRVYYAVGQNHRLLAFLSHTRRDSSVPVNALMLQGLVTTAIILSARIDQIIQYAGFTLVLFSALTVCSVMVLRVRRPLLERPFRVAGYPFTPLLFLVASLWMMIWNLVGEYWLQSLLSLLTVAAAALLFSLLNHSAD